MRPQWCRGTTSWCTLQRIASPVYNPPHVIVENNLLATYHTLEAAERSGVRRFVYMSSETVPGFSYPKRYFHADYADRRGPPRPAAGLVRDLEVLR
jgi:nucleoside-diphosphate-sugar epimerase